MLIRFFLIHTELSSSDIINRLRITEPGTRLPEAGGVPFSFECAHRWILFRSEDASNNTRDGGRMESTAKSDHYGLQRSRLERIVREMDPNWAIQFLTERARIRFRIKDQTSGLVLVTHSAAWKPTEIAFRSDHELRVLLLLASINMIF